MKRYSPLEAFEYLQLEGDRYLEIIKELPQGVNDVIETIRGYKIERFEKKTDEIRKYRTIDSIAKYTFLLGILLSSSYFAISGEGYLPVMGIVGFMSAIFLFAVMFVKSS